ncbi:MAG TPA: hypothetical protein VFA89_08340 [Terriglobales bacterium]|nr:hypothetical protein [Terriglobales bacterium]
MRLLSLTLLLGYYAVLATTPAFGQFSTVGLGTRFTNLEGVNNSGIVVGSQNDIGTFNDTAFQFSPQGFPMLVGVTLSQLGATSIDANGINNSNHIVGSYTDGRGHTHGYIKVGEIYRTVDIPGAIGTVATAINDNDEVAGYYFTNNTNHGFTDIGGTLVTVDYPGSRLTQIWGINNNGQISGLYSGGDCPQINCGFVAQSSTFTQIMHPGGLETDVFGINDAGTVVGFFSNFSEAHGFQEWGGIFTNIDVPEADPGTTLVKGINATGELVGIYTKTIPNTRGGTVVFGFVKKL